MHQQSPNWSMRARLCKNKSRLAASGGGACLVPEPVSDSPGFRMVYMHSPESRDELS